MLQIPGSAEETDASPDCFGTRGIVIESGSDQAQLVGQLTEAGPRLGP